MTKRTSYILDIEANGLVNEATQIHCAVIRSGGKYHAIEEPHQNTKAGELLYEIVSEAMATGILSGHHILGYDILVLLKCIGDPALGALYSDALKRLSVVDTLIVSRLLNYKIEGGHSLDAWGRRFGIVKVGKEITDWSKLTPLMLERCISDTEINERLYAKFERFIEDPAWFEALVAEHRTSEITERMTVTGIPFDRPKAEGMKTEIIELLKPIDAVIATDFPPRAVPIKEVHPRVTKEGLLNRADFRWLGNSDLTAFDGGPFTRFRYEEFNPGSPKQVVERMWKAGWKPTEKTDGHLDAIKERRVTEDIKRYGWKVSEENLATLPASAPEGARSLAKRITLASRLSDLEEWLALVGPDERLHPRYQNPGAWTGRLSHQRPNSANIPAEKPSTKDNEFEKLINLFNGRMRGLFVAPKGKRLIGTDADGIQMRIFAHVVNDERLIQALINGRKEDKSDIHSVHQRALGAVCGSRDEAKTFIYAFLLGAGIGKVAEIFQCSFSEAKAAVENFLNYYPGLRQLKKTGIPEWAARGYFDGLDGRKVPCDSAHLMLSGILQNGEKVIMARSMIEWTDELDRRGLPYELVNWVHDEWQTLIDDDDDLCAEVQKIQIDSIRHQGDLLHMACPLDGSSSWGYSWHETH